MILSRELSREEKKRSQWNYNVCSFINGASYMCLGETVIILFAVKLHAPNTVIGMIGAMIFLGFLMLPLGILHAAHFGAAKCYADFWVGRNIAALLVALSVPISFVSLPAAWAVILLGGFLFYGCRAAGLVMSQPLMGEISSADDRAKLLGNSTALFYISGSLALSLVSFILWKCDSLYVLMGVIVTGALLGVTASMFLRRIDESQTLRESVRRPLLRELRSAFFDSTIAAQIRAGFVINVSLVMLVPISVLALKRGYGVSDTTAVLFSMVQFGLAILGAYVAGRFSARFGPRMLAIAGYALAFPIAFFWLLAPSAGFVSAGASWWLLLFSIPFAIAGFATTGMSISMIHYFLMAVPKEKQVVVSIYINLVAGACAGLAGMVLTGGLLKLAGKSSEFLIAHPESAIAKMVSSMWGPVTDTAVTYRLFFLFAAIWFLIGFSQILRLRTVISEYKSQHGEAGVRTVTRATNLRPN
ncbi:MAG: MFS transporter [Victivallaceae bacterium]|nr:MFS transporter [Victivallaceae bacterium]